MTKQEITQAERFLAEIKALRNNASLQWVDCFNEAKNLEGKIQSCFSEFSPKGYSWNTIYANYQVRHCDRQEIDNALDIMYECLQSILNRIPQYDLVCRLRDDISYGKRIGVQYYRGFIEDKVSYYSAYFYFPQEVEELMTNWRSGKEVDEWQIESVFRLTLVTLEQQVDLLLSNEQSKKSVAPAPSIIFNQTLNQNQSVQVSTEVSIRNCICALEECETLDEEELASIKSQLNEIQELLKEKKRRKSVGKKVSDILKWLANKTTDVMIAVLPTLVAILSRVG